MIVSKPQTNTIVSFSFFLAITVVVLVMNVMSLSYDPAWYRYVLIALLVPIALLVIYKIFLRYKIIRMGNNQVEIRYPVIRRYHQYSVSDVVAWKENTVKTGKNSVYKELEIRFQDKRKVSFGQREQTEYYRMVSYLVQKAPKKKTA